VSQAFTFSVPAATEQIGIAVDQVLAQAPTWVDPSALNTSLTEALTNAIVHGVLEVTSSSRGEDFQKYLDQVELRAEEAAQLGASVSLAAETSATHFTVTLSWQGQGCPKDRQGPSSSPDPLAGSGLGSALIEALCDEVHWSADGRAVSLRFMRRQ
jgi:anti-sigma regulatory factor (Ser/Thr protein kinase)